MLCGACLSTCHFQSTHEKVLSLLPKHSTKINEGFAKNRWMPECVRPDRLTKFVGSFIQNTAHSTNTDGGIAKNHWRPECVQQRLMVQESQRHSQNQNAKPHRKNTARAEGEGFTKNRRKPACVQPDGLTGFMKNRQKPACVQPDGLTGSTKNCRKPACVQPDELTESSRVWSSNSCAEGHVCAPSGHKHHVCIE